MISSNSSLALSNQLSRSAYLYIYVHATSARMCDWSQPVRRHVKRLEKDVACKTNFPSDSAMATEGKKTHNVDYIRDIVCARSPPYCIIYLAVCNNNDAYRELHFTMPLTDHHCEEPFKFFVIKWQMRFSRVHRALKYTFTESTESSRCIMCFRVHGRFIRGSLFLLRIKFRARVYTHYKESLFAERTA